jgi:hypothetical protein
MRNLEQRLSKLEQASTAATRYFAFAGDTETPEQAIARQFPEGLAEGVEVIVFRWDT